MSFRSAAGSSYSVDSAMNTDEEDSRRWNFIQIARETVLSHLFSAPARALRRVVFSLLASTSRKFSPPTRPTPNPCARAPFPSSSSPLHYISAKFAGKSSRWWSPRVHTFSATSVRDSRRRSRTTTDHHGRFPWRPRVLSCVRADDCARFIHRARVSK